jgi:hypothetical protein
MAKFEDNLSPYLTVVEQGSTPANPAAGDQKLFVKTSDHLLYFVNSAGTVTAVGSGGLADQGVITYLDGTVAAAPATPAAGKLRLYAKTGKVLAVKDDAGVETVLGAGGGGAPTTSEYLVGVSDGGLSAEKVKAALYRNYDPNEYPASPNAENNEFDTALTGWAFTSATNLAADVTTYPGRLLIQASGTTSGAQAYRESYAPGSGNGFTVAAQITLGMPGNLGSNIAWQCGLVVLDSSDAVIYYIILLNDASTDNILTTRISATTAGLKTLQLAFGIPVYFAIDRATTSNVYRSWFSFDGITWNLYDTSAAIATTVAKIGFRINSGVTGSVWLTSDWFRRFGALTPPLQIGA